jgi:spermidine synthase
MHNAQLPRLIAHQRGMGGSTDVIETIWDNGACVRILSVEGSYQSATYVGSAWQDPVFDYYVLFDLMFEVKPDIQRVLLLGGGALGYPRYLLSTHPAIKLDVVEIDPCVIKLAQRYFYGRRLAASQLLKLQSPPRIICGDALKVLKDSHNIYHAILCDCFLADKPESRLYSDHAARLLKEHLTEDGAVLANVIAGREGPSADMLAQFAASLAHAGFTAVYAVRMQEIDISSPAAPAASITEDIGAIPDAGDRPDNVMVVATAGCQDLAWAERLY